MRLFYHFYCFELTGEKLIGNIQLSHVLKIENWDQCTRDYHTDIPELSSYGAISYSHVLCSICHINSEL